MLFRASIVVVAAFFAQQAWSANCFPGNYRDSSGNCHTCPAGTYSNVMNAPVCSPCAAGTGPNMFRTDCNTCGDGEYSTGGTNCMNCPAGQQHTQDHKGCEKCPKGWYNGSPGNKCQKCSAGKFNNVLGARSCCDCCAGFYSSSSGSTSCTQCPTDFKYSSVGSNDSGDCKSGKGTRPNPATSCTMVADNVCPNPTGGPPQGTAITRKRNLKCANGFTSCPRYSGRGGFDCVDTENDPESCGGCVGLDGEGSGTDCTAIKGVSVTRCVKRSCVIDSCRKGWVKSLDGTSCVLASHTTGSSHSDNLHIQDTDAKKLKRSSAKRAIRHTVF